MLGGQFIDQEEGNKKNKIIVIKKRGHMSIGISIELLGEVD